MLADNMKELHLAGGRFVKVEDWQTFSVLPKRVNVHYRAMVMPLNSTDNLDVYVMYDYHPSVQIEGTTKFHHINSETQHNGGLAYIIDFSSGVTLVSYHSDMPNYEVGRITYRGKLGVLASDCTPVTDTIGGVLHSLLHRLSHFFSLEVVAC